MEQTIKILGLIYPVSLLLVIVLTAILYSIIFNRKKSKLLNILLLVSVVIYFLSFFSNYPMQLFMIVWFIRDLLIFFLLTKIWKLFLRFKISFIIGLFLVALGLGFLYYKNGAFSFSKVGGTSYDYDAEAELLFEISNKENLKQVKDLLISFNPEILIAFPQIADTSITELDNCYTIDIKDTSNLNSIKTLLEKSGLINWIENNETYTLSPIENLSPDSISSNSFTSKSLNDPFISKLWGFKYMEIDHLSGFLQRRKPAKKAKIFILDTGVDSKHEDLSDNYVSLSDKYDKDTDQHGTHCAGIACAVSNNKIGIASINTTGEFTTITGITVLPGGSGTQESIIDGILLATDNEADVISMSLGGMSTDIRQKAYEKAIKYANDKGSIIVVAAGNEGSNAKNVVPASCKGVIAVSAVDENLEKATFSNFVSDIEYKVAAPGVNIYSTIPLNEYKSMNGTSMATPFVAGLIGIMKSFEPEITTEETVRVLISSGIDTKNINQTGKFIQPLKSIINLRGLDSNSRLEILMRTLHIRPFKFLRQANSATVDFIEKILTFKP